MTAKLRQGKQNDLLYPGIWKNDSVNDRDVDELLPEVIYRFFKPDDPDSIEIAEIFVNSEVSPANNPEAVMSSVYVEHEKLILFFIAKRTELNKFPRNGEGYLLPEAVNIDSKMAADILLSNGADIDINTDYSAMHEACKQNNYEMISLLLRNGAHISPNGEFGTPFSFLDDAEDNYDQCKTLMIKEFSKMDYKNLPIFASDFNSIIEDSEAKEKFEKCKNELKQMANTKFYNAYSFYSVLDKSLNIKKLAYFTKNEELASKFQNIGQQFSYYHEDLQRIWAEAVQVRENIEIVESKLNSIF